MDTIKKLIFCLHYRDITLSWRKLDNPPVPSCFGHAIWSSQEAWFKLMKPEISMIMNGRSDGSETVNLRFAAFGANPIDQGVSAAFYDGTSG